MVKANKISIALFKGGLNSDLGHQKNQGVHLCSESKMSNASYSFALQSSTDFMQLNYTLTKIQKQLLRINLFWDTMGSCSRGLYHSSTSRIPWSNFIHAVLLLRAKRKEMSY